MALKLIVTEPFDAFVKGDEITDADLVAKHLEERRNHVVPVNVADPAPETKSKG